MALTQRTFGKSAARIEIPLRRKDLQVVLVVILGNRRRASLAFGSPWVTKALREAGARQFLDTSGYVHAASGKILKLNGYSVLLRRRIVNARNPRRVSETL